MVAFGQSFSPFGRVTGSQGYDTTHYGFTGEWEDENGLLFLRARYYDAGQGRFISRDPFPGYLSQPSTLNAYPYTLNNPATLTDPSGEISPIAIIAIAGFAAGAVYDAYQQTDGFTDFCQYDILQTLSAGVGGAAAASLTAIMLVSGVGMLGMGLQGVALGLSSIGISAGVSTSLFIAGTTTVSWAGMAMSWLFTQQTQSQISEIDKMKQMLTDAATRAQQSVGEGSGPAYGTQVHTAFAKEVKALGRSDLFSEISYLPLQRADYGTPGSIRVDVVYGTIENPITIFDLKTGTAALSQSRIMQIQSHLPIQDVPVIEVRP